MRLLGLLLVVLLAGCGEAPTLQAYLILPAEAPEDCVLSEDTNEAEDARAWGRPQNPGPIDAEAYDQPAGVDASDNLYATYACGDGDIYAFAIRFPDTQQADAFVAHRTPCASDQGMIQKGAIVARYDVDGDVQHRGLSSKMAQRLDATLIC